MLAIHGSLFAVQWNDACIVFCVCDATNNVIKLFFAVAVQRACLPLSPIWLWFCLVETGLYGNTNRSQPQNGIIVLISDGFRDSLCTLSTWKLCKEARGKDLHTCTNSFSLPPYLICKIKFNIHN